MKVVSLFTGAMGLDLGLEATGFKTSVCVEFDQACQKTIRANRPSLPVLGDITKISAKELNGLCPDPCLVVGGPPCQPFSSAGKRQGTNDKRGLMPFEFIRVVGGMMPRFFVMENVRGLVSSRSSKGAEPGDLLKDIIGMLEAIGYSISWAVLDAVDYGVPQFRERVIVIGSRDKEPIFLPAKTHFQTHQESSMRWRTLRHAISGMEDAPGEFQSLSPSRLQWMEKIAQGQNWKSLSEEDQRLAMGGAFMSEGGRCGFFRRLSFNEPCPTLVTSPAQKSTMLCHPTKDRPLGAKEYAAIQEFPATWKFEGSLMDVYRQIGNAVPVGLGRAIGTMLMAVIKGEQTTIKTKRFK